MTYETPKNWKTGNIVTAALLNTYISGNQTALKAPPSDIVNVSGTAFSCDSTSFNDIDGAGTAFAIEITTTGGAIFLWANINLMLNTAIRTTNVAYFDIYDVTNTTYLGGDDGLYAQHVKSSASSNVYVHGACLTHWIEDYPAGTYSFKLRWKDQHGDSSLIMPTTNFGGVEMHPQFGAREMS